MKPNSLFSSSHFLMSARFNYANLIPLVSSYTRASEKHFKSVKRPTLDVGSWRSACDKPSQAKRADLQEFVGRLLKPMSCFCFCRETERAGQEGLIEERQRRGQPSQQSAQEEQRHGQNTVSRTPMTENSGLWLLLSTSPLHNLGGVHSKLSAVVGKKLLSTDRRG